MVNTHEHFDHTFGNGAFRAAYGAVPVHAHEVAAEQHRAGRRADQGAVRRPRQRRRPAPRRGAGDRDRAGGHDVLLRGRARPRRPAGRAGPPRPRPHRRRPGGPGARRRRAAGRRPGRGVRAARTGVPGFGGDCYPMEWPLTLDVVLGLLTSASVVVPGHGAPVDREFVEEPAQRRSASSPRRSATSPPAAYRSPRRWTPPSGPTRARSSRTPYAAATSSCPAARSGSRSSDRRLAAGYLRA